MLDDELASMTLIRALPDDYNGFISSLLLKDKLDKSTVQSAFITQEIQQRRRANDQNGSNAAFRASTSSSSTLCDFCSEKGHNVPNCASYKTQKAYVERSKRRGARKAKDAENKANNAETPKEFAGNASARSNSSITPPDYNWIADTGATSHMTPHRHWMRNYTPYRTPVRLADNTIVYSAGLGSVVFQPFIRGKALRPVEFSRVLHVPALCNNLLSCLYLTKHKNFTIYIDSEGMHFNVVRKRYSTRQSRC